MLWCNKINIALKCFRYQICAFAYAIGFNVLYDEAVNTKRSKSMESFSGAPLCVNDWGRAATHNQYAGHIRAPCRDCSPWWWSLLRLPLSVLALDLFHTTMGYDGRLSAESCLAHQSANGSGISGMTCHDTLASPFVKISKIISITL